MVGKSIGKYRILAPLGSGGMGAVYRATDTALGRDVAIKMLHRDRADRRLVDRFQAEATTLARLNHPDIATIYELFRSRHDLLLVMELVRGETLESVCERVGTLAPRDAASLADKILAALDHAHTVGVVHCDVKPANVMLTDGGRIKMMDFGTARVRGVAAQDSDGCTVGTPAYMSPEQLLGDEVDERADLYAVGVVLYRLLAGTLPFDGDTALAVAQQHVANAPVPPQAHRPELPEWCDTILRRALAKSPDDRFHSAHEFRDAIRTAAGMTAAELAQPCAISVRISEAANAPGRRPLAAAARRPRAASTIVLKDDRRFRDVEASGGRAFALGSLTAAMVAVIAMLTIASLRAPAAALHTPMASSTTPVVLHGRAIDRSRKPARATTCRIELSSDRITVNAAGTNALLHDVRYEDVASVDFATGGAGNHDRVALRMSRPKPEVIVLRFDGEADAARALEAIEERLAKPALETRESTR